MTPAIENSGSIPLGRLKWRCRRGMRELDAVLQQFFERESAGLSPGEIEAFSRLLDLQDPELHGYVIGGHEPADPATAALVARIRAGHRPIV